MSDTGLTQAVLTEAEKTGITLTQCKAGARLHLQQLRQLLRVERICQLRPGPARAGGRIGNPYRYRGVVSSNRRPY
ncbi:hypothetical protein LT85_3271 [Collimonas arenae]|uniref:Uncharacterized protein n=1 Tax=Collimonas arenae TaxID=279058 RepID=A0A0A1FFI0_9BURK|nr:hypothetical protein LT85_3271 [Collimonas arenae]